MKIVNNNISIDETFSSLKVGDVFLYKGNPFVKITNSFDEYGYNAFSLNGNYVKYLEDWDLVVILPNAYLTLG